jgi:hypothetical protein
LHSIDINTSSLILYSLDPGIDKDEPENSPAVFHGYRILGRTDIVGQNEKQELLVTLATGIEKSDGTISACFNPRHGLRVTTPTGQFDLSICFECLQVYTFDFAGAHQVSTTREPMKLYDSLVRKYKLPHDKEPTE